MIDCSRWVLPNRYWADYGLISFRAFTQCGILPHYTINDFPAASQGTIVLVVFTLLSIFDNELLNASISILWNCRLNDFAWFVINNKISSNYFNKALISVLQTLQYNISIFQLFTKLLNHNVAVSLQFYNFSGDKSWQTE